MKKEQPKCKISSDGTKRWYLNGKRHREDGPAVEYPNGTKEWRLHGKYHREDGPAIERANGSKEWFLHGKLHREDGPACEYPGGRRRWYLNDEKVHPETLVDLHLSRGTFCYYNPETQTLHFAESK